MERHGRGAAHSFEDPQRSVTPRAAPHFMTSLILLVVVAAWLAVLIPPLLRSRLENRPNSSVSDFRNQLSSLQRAMPSSRTVTVRSMGRPLAPSPLPNPAAAGRPVLRSGVRTHGAGNNRSAGQQAAVRPRHDVARLHDASLRSRSHGDPRARSGHPAPAPAEPLVADPRRRRANVYFVLVFVLGCSVFLALTTKAQSLVYLAGAAGLSIVAYAYVLGQARHSRRASAPPPPRRRPVAQEHRTQRALGGDVRRERSHRVEHIEQGVRYDVPVQRDTRVHASASSTSRIEREGRNGARRQGVPARRSVDRWSPAV